jgi:hypothetical protein
MMQTWILLEWSNLSGNQFSPWGDREIKPKRKPFLLGRKKLEEMLKEWRSIQIVQRAVGSSQIVL